jgi:hypothetical protein
MANLEVHHELDHRPFFLERGIQVPSSRSSRSKKMGPKFGFANSAVAMSEFHKVLQWQAVVDDEARACPRAFLRILETCCTKKLRFEVAYALAAPSISIMIRLLQGHSNVHVPLHYRIHVIIDENDVKTLHHMTKSCLMDSILTHGPYPGGTDGSRDDLFFACQNPRNVTKKKFGLSERQKVFKKLVNAPYNHSAKHLNAGMVTVHVDVRAAPLNGCIF